MNENIFSYINKRKTYVPIASGVIEHIIKTPNLPLNAKLYYIIADLLAHIKLKTNGQRNVTLSGTSWTKILCLSENRVFFFQKKLESEGYFVIKRKKNNLNKNVKNIIIPTLPESVFLNLKNDKIITKTNALLNFNKEKRYYLDISTFFVKINYIMIKKLVQEKNLTTFEKLIWLYCFLKTHESKNKHSFCFTDQYKNIASFFSCSECIISKSLMKLSRLEYIQKEKFLSKKKSTWKIKLLLPEDYIKTIIKEKDRKSHLAQQLLQTTSYKILNKKSYKIEVQENRNNNINIKNKINNSNNRGFIFITNLKCKTYLSKITFKKENSMCNTQFKNTNRILFAIKFISRTEIFCLLLLWFMVILILGTLAQKEIGLYSAQRQYFSSTCIWIWDKLPLPGGKTTFFLIFLSLSVKLIFDKFVLKKIGTIILHIGVLILLLGSFLTMKFGEEGSLFINEGSESNIVTFNNEYVLNVNNGIIKNNFNINENFKDIIIKPGMHVKIRKICKNSELQHRKKFLNNDDALGIARFFNLSDIPLFAESENNKAGLILSVSFKDTEKLCYLLEDISDNQQVELDNNVYSVSLNKHTKQIPFYLHLEKFEKEVYPGTNNAKSYKSKLLIKEPNGITWHANVEMNKPLRYKGYTFYQTSFIENNLGAVTILSVVKNSGNKFFYISGCVMFLGLMLHLINFLQKRPFSKI